MLLGRLPGKVRCAARADARLLARRRLGQGLLEGLAQGEGCPRARRLASSASWLARNACPGRTTPMKSTGTTSVPWCSAWKKACWAFCADVAPEHGHGGLRHGLAATGDALAQALHFQLLQERRQLARNDRHGDHGKAGVTEAIAVPDARQREQTGRLSRQGRAKWSSTKGRHRRENYGSAACPRRVRRSIRPPTRPNSARRRSPTWAARARQECQARAASTLALTATSAAQPAASPS